MPKMAFLQNPIQTNSLPEDILEYWVWIKSKKVLIVLNLVQHITRITTHLSFRHNQPLPIKILRHCRTLSWYNSL